MQRAANFPHIFRHGRRTFLCIGHSVFDSQVAHRRHRRASDLAHRTRPRPRPHVRAGQGTHREIRGESGDRSRAEPSRDPGTDSRLRSRKFPARRQRRPAPRVAARFSGRKCHPKNPGHGRPYPQRTHQRRNDPRHLRRLHRGPEWRGHLLRTGRARSAGRRFGGARSEALGGLFGQ